MASLTAVYGAPPLKLATVPQGSVQLSPLVPGGQSMDTLDGGAFDAIVVLAPPGAIERRYVLAHALRLLKPGGELTALATKNAGGLRLRAELEAFGCEVTDTPKGGHRICRCERPAAKPEGLDEVLAEGGPQILPDLGLWSQPGVFSWNRIDPGSAALVAHLPAGHSPLSGRGADFGCGIGYLSRTVLTSAKVTDLLLVDIDRRAVDAARRNIDDPRARFEHADVRHLALENLDFVVMNPPFHDGGDEDRSLGQAFIRKASQSLRKGKSCWLVANRHLPYEAILAECFTRVVPQETPGGYKVFEAIK
ncbi:MAG: methyltransferase [Caulobacterales bacterium 68-7]|nr:class I SAM-dependent methyltransferase [Caulobacterales bacterium]OJU10591.1 MAG: methyltransferase [Caulobacterales bacterium 68-7]